MSFDKKVFQIRNGIKRYSKISIVKNLLQRLHSRDRNQPSAFMRHWVVCLMLEWTLELDNNKSTKEATSGDVQKLLDKLWMVSSDALDLSKSKNVWLTMCIGLLQQLRFQADQSENIYFLARLYTIMCEKSSSTYFKNEFKKHTGIELNDFFVFAFFLGFIFKDNDKPYYSYSRLIPLLLPGFSYEFVQKALLLIGSDLNSLQSLMLNMKPQTNVKHVSREEYFAEPKLLLKPIIFLPEGLCTPHSYIALIGVSEFVLRTLKKAAPEKFRQKFSIAFEQYIGSLFKDFSYQVHTEKVLKNIYKKHNIQGKSVDFLHTSREVSIFFDAKGVEPKQDLLLTDNEVLIKDKLRDTILKGITQAAECIDKLVNVSEIKIAPFEKRYALVITHQDFYLGNGVKLASYLGDEYRVRIDDVVKDKLPLDNVHFCGVAELENILAACRAAGTSLDNFLDFCTVEEADPHTAKFMIKQHIEAYKKKHNIEQMAFGTDRLNTVIDELSSKAHLSIQTSQKYWKQGSFLMDDYIQLKNEFLNMSVRRNY